MKNLYESLSKSISLKNLNEDNYNLEFSINKISSNDIISFLLDTRNEEKNSRSYLNFETAFFLNF